MRVLITGSSGLIGGSLARQCSESGCSVLGIDIREPDAGYGVVDFELCDIRDANRLNHLVSVFRPDRVFHMAAQSSAVESVGRARETFDVNVGGTIALFESLRDFPGTLVLVACSSAEYGIVADAEIPVCEDHALRPVHPYGVSKVAQDLLAAQYFNNYSIPSIRLRIFPTTGPGKIGDVCSDLTRRAVEIRLGLLPPSLQVGNLKSRRAILDVRDLVRALWLAGDCCEPGEVYNIGADRIYSVPDIIEELRGQLGVHFDIQPRRELLRMSDEPVIAGNNAKFRECCAWAPEIALSTTLKDMLDWWTEKLGGSGASKTATQGPDLEHKTL